MVMSQTFPYSHCSHGSNNTASTKFRNNLDNLFNGKLYNERGNSLSFNTTDGEIPDRVYSNYICRFDFSPETCRNCVNNATKNIVEQCNGTQKAILWKMAIVAVLSAPTTIHSLWLISFLSFCMSRISLADDKLHRIGYSCNRTFNNNIASAIYGLNWGRLFTQKLYTDAIGYSIRECDQNTKNAITCARFQLDHFWNSPAAQEPVSPVEAPPPVSDKIGGADLGRHRKENRAWIPIKEESNSQEVQLLRLSKGRIGNDYSYDTFFAFSGSSGCFALFCFCCLAFLYVAEKAVVYVKSLIVSFASVLLLLSLAVLLLCIVLFCLAVSLLPVFFFVFLLGVGCVFCPFSDLREDPIDRPSMSSVVAMLVSDNIRLPQPTQSTFSVSRAVRQGQSSSDVSFFSNEATGSQGQSSSNASDFSNETARRVRFSSDVV
ncbi:hypothetical protein QYF36_011438 [Acer negundo]|nr:hypothetical protein QYF36_011438 [Acer negundo]